MKDAKSNNIIVTTHCQLMTFSYAQGYFQIKSLMHVTLLIRICNNEGVSCSFYFPLIHPLSKPKRL